MGIIKKIAIFNITLFMSCQISSAPIIEKTTGDILDKHSILLSGKNFTTPNATTLFWDTVDNQSTMQSNVNVPTDKNTLWSENGSSWTTPITFDTKNTRNNRSASYAGLTKSYLKWPNKLKDKQLKNIYVSWWFKPNKDPKDSGGANKLIRIWDATDGLSTRISWTTMHLTVSANDIGYSPKPSWGDWQGNNGSWNRLDIWVSNDTNTIKTWVNNELVHDISDFKKSTISTGLNVYLMGFDPSHSNLYPEFNFKMSDIYISPSIARVEITDKPNWDDSTAIREIQPIESWSNNEIQVTLNAGGFSNLSNKYLYVIDENGGVNKNGFPLCTKCPIPPNMTIE